MIASQLFRAAITPVFGVFFAICGYISFGDPAVFDKLFIGVLFALFFYSSGRKDYNFTSLIFILLVWELLAELVYMIDINASIILKLLLYGLLILPTFLFKIPTPIRAFIQVFIAWASVNELYWLAIEKNAPDIYWDVFICAGCTYIALLVFARPFIMNWLKSNSGEATQIDFYIHILLLLHAFLSALSLLEYTLRHTFHIQSMLIYDHYIVLTQILSLIGLFIISRGYTGYVLESHE